MYDGNLKENSLFNMKNIEKIFIIQMNKFIIGR